MNFYSVVSQVQLRLLYFNGKNPANIRNAIVEILLNSCLAKIAHESSDNVSHTILHCDCNRINAVVITISSII